MRALIVGVTIFVLVLVATVALPGCRQIPILGPLLNLIDPPPAKDDPDGEPAASGIDARFPWTTIVAITVLFGGGASAALIGYGSPNIALWLLVVGGAFIVGILSMEFWLEVMVGGAVLTAVWFAPSIASSVSKAKTKAKAKIKEPA